MDVSWLLVCVQSESFSFHSKINGQNNSDSWKKVTSIIDNVKDIHLPTIKDKYVAIIVIPMSIHLFLFLFIKAFALITSTSSESKSFNVLP